MWKKYLITIMIAIFTVCMFSFLIQKLSLPILSAEKKEQIEADWNFREAVVWFDKSSRNSLHSSVRYYGSYGGYDILFSNLGLQTDSFESISIAGVTIRFGSSFQMYAYRDGVFYTLQEVYDREEITDSDVETIADMHERYQKIRQDALDQ